MPHCVTQKQIEMQKTCIGCIYFIDHCCMYFDKVGHRRPCPPGKLCTVKEVFGKRKKKKKEELPHDPE